MELFDRVKMTIFLSEPLGSLSKDCFAEKCDEISVGNFVRSSVVLLNFCRKIVTIFAIG